jgi:hypothetical protein
MREHERGDDTEGWGWDVRRLGKGKVRLPGAAILMAYEARKRPAPDTTGWREIAPSPLTATPRWTTPSRPVQGFVLFFVEKNQPAITEGKRFFYKYSINIH